MLKTAVLKLDESFLKISTSAFFIILHYPALNLLLDNFGHDFLKITLTLTLSPSSLGLSEMIK